MVEKRPSRKSRVVPILMMATGVLPALGIVHLLVAGVPVWPLLAYPVASLLTFYVYWDDKRRAVRGAWRTSEAVLHVCELLGGWPGALLAQQRLRHKNRKLSFQLVFWLIVLVHQVFWAFLASTLLLGEGGGRHGGP